MRRGSSSARGRDLAPSRFVRTSPRGHEGDELSLELFGIDRLDQVEVESRVPGTPVIGIEAIAANADEHRLLDAGAVADASGHFMTVDLGQSDIQEDDVEGPGLREVVDESRQVEDLSLDDTPGELDEEGIMRGLP